MDRYICIHGHFYQPPRENPWLEAIELQDSAYPYHDWNERVTAECYAPNAASRILSDRNRITQIINNYAKISFNVGPTLLSWMERESPDVYQMILQADQRSQVNFGGHGSALAQPYSHTILPLANCRDKHTQIVWGIRDFERRFRRKTEGIWLPETAVDLETLDILAEQGIRFTILAPHQVSRVRRIGTRTWRSVSGDRIDPSMPYLVSLPSGRRIAIFAYDGPISRAVAFEGLLGNGERFAQRLVDGFDGSRTWPQLVHIATDGETYGHHHPHGDMALAYALEYIETHQLARLTNYGEYLEHNPPTHEIDIVENSSWSCVHGIERWRGNCGCNSGERGDWNQEWRRPLRRALDWLRDTLAPLYERSAKEFLADPWVARDEYVDVVLDRTTESVDRFLARHRLRDLDDDERVVALKLLELQRHVMLMYTSCGWFFDEISGIETVQILQYAGRAMQLAQEIFGDHVEAKFIRLLERAPSNLPEYQNGAQVYQKLVKPASVDLKKVAAHYAVSSLFEAYPPRSPVYCYTVDRKHYQSFRSGQARVAVGTAEITSQITGESGSMSFGILHFGDHNLSGGVRVYRGLEEYQALRQEVGEAFAHADLPLVLSLLDKHFGGVSYSLKSLFRDEQRRVLIPIVAAALSEAEAEYRQIYEHHAFLMRYLVSLGIPLPETFRSAVGVVLNADLQRAVKTEILDHERIANLLREASNWGIAIDSPGLGHGVQQAVERMVKQFQRNPLDASLLRRLVAVTSLIRSSHLSVNLWKVQNAYYAMRGTVYPELVERADRGDDVARSWVLYFRSLGEDLGF